MSEQLAQSRTADVSPARETSGPRVHRIRTDAAAAAREAGRGARHLVTRHLVARSPPDAVTDNLATRRTVRADAQRAPIRVPGTSLPGTSLLDASSMHLT